MMTKKFNPLEHLLFEGMAGSHLYGMNTPESDVDTRGVCLPPKSVMLHPFEKFEVADSFENEDKAVYSLSKFFALCADNNPNILEMLFVPQQFTLFSTPQWEAVAENRHLFLSKNVKHRFLGYAFSQLEAIKRHREWFINPPAQKPTREDFGLTQNPLVSEANLQYALSLPHELFQEQFVEELKREREYRDAKKKWDNFNTWQKNRNPKRKGSEEKFGYDTKYAAHLFRLMSEGKQLLLNGEIVFPLENAEELLAIKNGALEYENMLELAREMEQKFEEWYAVSHLPNKPDRNALTDLYFYLLGV